MSSTTSSLGLYKPTVGETDWGITVDSNWDTLDTLTTKSWADYSATSTIVGWTSFGVKSIYTKKIGKTVFVGFALQGVSNSVETTFTLPYTSAPIAVYYNNVMLITKDNNITVTGEAVLPNNSNTVTCYPNMTLTGSNWTASGNKQCYGSFWYESA